MEQKQGGVEELLEEDESQAAAVRVAALVESSYAEASRLPSSGCSPAECFNNKFSPNLVRTLRVKTEKLPSNKNKNCLLWLIQVNRGEESRTDGDNQGSALAELEARVRCAYK